MIIQLSEITVISITNSIFALISDLIIVSITILVLVFAGVVIGVVIGVVVSIWLWYTKCRSSPSKPEPTVVYHPEDDGMC